MDADREQIANLLARHGLALIDSFPVGLALTDGSLRVLYANAYFKEIICREKVCGEFIHDMITLSTLSRETPQEIIATLNAGRSWSGETIFLDASGRARNGSLFLSPSVNGGKTELILLTIRDITDQTRARVELIRNESRFRAIVQNIREYIYSVEYDEAGRVISTYHSPRCEEVTGYTPDDFHTKKDLWYEMIHPEDRTMVNDFLRQIESGRKGLYIEHRILHKSGETRWVSNSCSVMRDHKGRIMRSDGFLLDITDRKRDLDRLKKLSVAVEQSPATVVITDRRGIIEYVNPKFEKLTGYALAEVKGLNPRILKSGDMPDSFYAEMWKTILAGKDWTGDFHNRKKNGELYWEHATISPIRGADDEILNFIAVKEDITAMRAAQEEIREKDAELRYRSELMEEDMMYARKVQLSLLPESAPANDFLKVSYRFRPLSLVGGDFLSFYDHDNQLSVFVADVVGHGIAAALFMSLLRYAGDTISSDYHATPGAFLSELNRTLYGTMYNYFITAVFTTFRRDGNGVIMEFANGGHPPVIIYRRRTESVELLQAKGTILGMFESGNYAEAGCRLEKGDRVYLYTDGMPETVNEDKEIVGYAGCGDLIKRVHCEDIDESLDRIFMELDHFRGKSNFEDDILLVAVDIL